MHELTHYRLCPFSRSIRIALAEIGLEVALKEERPWEWRASFLALNPAGELPVLALHAGPILCGAYAISEFIAEEVVSHPADGLSVPLFPGNREERAEVRRLVDWFHRKFDREVTRELMVEKVYSRQGGPAVPPDATILRAVRVNLRHHVSYVNYLADQRRWLAGDTMSFADIAAAAHLSCADYLGEVAWDDAPAARVWYQRIKSRPAFRGILADRIPGSPPPLHYTNLDF
jgi:glutathione S-transferase